MSASKKMRSKRRLQINGRQQQHNEKMEIEELQLELDKEKIQMMVGNDLRKQLEAFRNVGAPNFDNVPTRSVRATL